MMDSIKLLHILYIFFGLMCVVTNIMELSVLDHWVEVTVEVVKTPECMNMVTDPEGVKSVNRGRIYLIRCHRLNLDSATSNIIPEKLSSLPFQCGISGFKLTDTGDTVEIVFRCIHVLLMTVVLGVVWIHININSRFHVFRMVVIVTACGCVVCLISYYSRHPINIGHMLSSITSQETQRQCQGLK
jgi:hypothetical protein